MTSPRTGRYELRRPKPALLSSTDGEYDLVRVFNTRHAAEAARKKDPTTYVFDGKAAAQAAAAAKAALVQPRVDRNQRRLRVRLELSLDRTTLNAIRWSHGPLDKDQIVQTLLGLLKSDLQIIRDDYTNRPEMGGRRKVKP